MLLHLPTINSTQQISNPPTASTSRERSSDCSLRVLSLNLAHGRKLGGHQLFLGRKTIINNLLDVADVLRREQPTVVALQEADAASAWNGGFSHVEFLAKHAHFEHHVYGDHMAGLRLHYGTALLSTQPLVEVESYTFQRWMPFPPKGFVVATTTVDDVETDFVSIHLDFLRKRVRLHQVEEIISYLSRRARPRVLLGDFNCEWHSKDSALQHLSHALNVGAYRPDDHSLFTFPGMRRRFDWILASPEFKFDSYSVLPDHLSDHLAVMSELTLAA